MPGVIGLDSVDGQGRRSTASTRRSGRTAAQLGQRGEPLQQRRRPRSRRATVNGGVRVGTGRRHAPEGRVVTGDVTAGTTITNNGTINGTATPNSPSPTINPPDVAPCSPFSGTARHQRGTFSYNAAKGDLTVERRQDRDARRRHVLLPRPHPLGWVEAERRRPVKIFLTGQLEAAAAAASSTRRPCPPNLQISSSYAGKDGVKLSGGSSAYLSVYAPTTSVELSRRLAGLRRAAREDARALGRLGRPLRRPDGHRLGAVLHALIEPRRGAGSAGAPLDLTSPRNASTRSVSSAAAFSS